MIHSCVSLQSNTISIGPINENDQGQMIEGFGGSLTHSSAYLLKGHNRLERKKILMDLFDRAKGIGLSYLKIPMGTSDFRPKEDYTFADLPSSLKDPFSIDQKNSIPLSIRHEQLVEDTSAKERLTFFSIKKDEKYFIPILRKILKINPHITILGSPYTAPKWMTTNNHLNAENYETYALYFVKFIQAYATHNIRIHAVTLQNELQYTSDEYPTMRMSVMDQKRFAAILENFFIEYKISTKIIGYDLTGNDINYPIQILGFTLHSYKGEAASQTSPYNKFPDLNIHFMECESSLGSEFGNGLKWNMTHLIIGATQNWAECVLKWNLVLDEKGGPKIPGGHENGRGILTIPSNYQGNYSRNVDYYAFGHASKFVQPGATLIIRPSETNIENLDYVIFKNPDESIVFVLYNQSYNEQIISFKLSIWGNIKENSFDIPEKSACTIVFWPDKEPHQVVTSSNGHSTLLNASS